ncbi:FecR family protein [Sphingobacterium spiritivorum]|uniref:FecR family protein n=1 Tax=Sphingobacterium spiritivorum TaxID=258 RepID=UPI003DA2420D
MNEMSRPSRETLLRYFKGACPPNESKLVELYLSMDIDKEYVESCIAEVWDELGPHARLNTDDSNLEKFKEQLDQKKGALIQLPPLDHPRGKQWTLFRLPTWMKVAAAVLLIGGSALVIYNKLRTDDTLVAQQENDILPGSDKALLTLSDGSTVSLSEAENGKIAAQHGLRIEKTNEGEIVYQTNGGSAAKANAFNSVVTPNGGQYRVILPDGSKALLNAASSLTYPVHFDKRERRVKMTGEVYFEIAKATNDRNERLPFFVETDKQEIQVLGTTFNVSAYKDDPYHYTTLIEGSVRLMSSADGRFTLLKPGQHAIVGRTVSVSEADMKRDLAWVNGNFIFRREELHSILRKISRWYDVEVECPPELGKMKFTGKVSRSQPLSAVVEMISSLDKINIQLKERRITVTK